MRPIPTKLRKEMSEDPFYGRCCLSGVQKGYDIKIEWHHNLIFAGRQVNEKWCILPVIKSLHDAAYDPEVKDKMDWVMLNRADEETLKKYSKAVDLTRRRDQLNERFGVYKVKN